MERDVSYDYHDILKKPLGADELSDLARRGGITVKELLNPKSSGFKNLDLNPDMITDDLAARLINEHPKIMRRPLLSDGNNLVIGFDSDCYKIMTA